MILPQLTLGQSKQVKMLQSKNEEMNTRLQKLLTKLKVPTCNAVYVDPSYCLDLGLVSFLNKLSMVTARIFYTLALGFENPYTGENKLIVIALQS